MTLGRAWVGEAFRASAATLLAPTAILLAVALSAGSGGIEGLGSLGQLISGPAPRADVESTAGAETDLSGGETVVLAPATGAPVAGASNAGTTTSGGALVRAPAPTGGPIAEIKPPRSPGEQPATPERPGGSPPPGQPPQQPGVVEQLGDSAKGVTDELPGPLGPTVGDLIDQVVGTCRQVQCP